MRNINVIKMSVGKVVIKEKPEGQNKNQEYGYCTDNVFIAI